MVPNPRFLFCSVLILIQSIANCKEAPKSAQITNGFPAAPSSYRYIVAIMQPPEDINDGANMYGGGVILDGNWVLTARSVISRSDKLSHSPSKISIYPKYNNNLRKTIYDKAKAFKAAKFFCAPASLTDVVSKQSDLALIKLTEPIPLGVPPHQFSAINISKSTEPWQRARIAGWGRTDLHEPASKMNDLMEAEIKLPPTVCFPKCKIFTRIKSPIGGYPNPCFGDEGSPAVIRNPRTFEDELVGVIAWFDFKCLMKSVYINATTYLPWIKNVMERELPKYEC